MNSEGKTKVKWTNSVRFQVIMAILFNVIFALLLMVQTYGPKMKKNVRDINYNYITDLAISNGEHLSAYLTHNMNIMPETAVFKDLFDGTGVRDMDSSYVYIVAYDGTMLYHPNADKIGKPVENEAIKDILSDLNSGKNVETQTIKYKYKGDNKLAGICIDKEHKFLTIVTVDESEMMHQTNRILKQGISATIFCVIIAILIGLSCTKYIVKPIKILLVNIEKLANMDLTDNEDSTILDKNKSEIGLINVALKVLRKELIDTVASIKNQTDRINIATVGLDENTDKTNTSMQQVAAAVDDIAQSATSQATETQMATEDVVAMGELISRMDDEVERLQEYAKDMDEASNNAQSIFDELGTINAENQRYINGVSDQTNRTNESVKDIQKAVEIISSIAEETNLLSLNASIEAARAGEQGRGFAVVAAQIQKLAEQSTKSAGEIEAVVKVLLAESENAVAIMEKVLESTETQTKCVENTNEAFQSIKTNLVKSVDSMKAIAARTQELNTSRNNVIDVVQNLSAIAEENAASTEETNASVVEVTDIVNEIASKSEELDIIAKNLKDNVSIFKY